MKTIWTMTMVLSLAGLLAGTARGQTYPKWLAIGDSITLHGPKEELQWTGEARGMASSEPANDYVHQLKALLQGKDPGNAQEVKVAGRIGKLSGGTVDQIMTVLTELKAWNADLVTIQLGENDHFAEIGAAGFEERYRNVVDTLLSAEKRPMILCTGVWAPGQGLEPGKPDRYQATSEAGMKDAIIEKICKEKGLVFVSIAKAAFNPANRGYGAVPGVQWHPNDAGMKAYADAIFQGFCAGAGAPATP